MALSLAWLDSVRYPFGAFQLSQSFKLARVIDEGGITALFKTLSGPTGLGSLNFSIWALVSDIFGISRNCVPIANALWFLPAFFAMHLLARRATETNWAGPLACALMLAAPHVALYSRVPFDEVPMGALCVVMVWGLTASERFMKPLPLLAAVAAMTVGMLMKRTFALYALAPALYTFIECVIYGYSHKREDEEVFFTGRRIFLGASFLIFTAALIAVSRRSEISFASAQHPGGGLFDQSLWYLRQMYNYSLSAPLTAALVVCLPWTLAAKGLRAGLAVSTSLVGAYLMITIMPLKDIRFATPLIPLCALGTAIGLAAAGDVLGEKWKKAAIIAGIGLAVLGLGNVYNAGFGKKLLPMDSGYPGGDSAQCVDDFDKVFSSIEKYLRGGAKGENVTLALHPLTPMSLSMNLDLVLYDVSLFNARQKRSARTLGFEYRDYWDFPALVEGVDVLLVTQNIWDMPREKIEQALLKSNGGRDPEADSPPVSDADPQYRTLIESLFVKAESISTKCAGVVEVYQRNDPSIQSHAAAAQGL